MSATPLSFLHGVPRCGSTWLTQALDASPEVRLYTEPFAEPRRLFPELPPPAVFLDRAPPELVSRLAADLLPRLDRAKALFTRRSLTSPGWFGLERRIAAALMRAGRFAPSGLRQRAIDFHNLSLHRMHGDAPLVPKRATPARICIKELRLFGKLPAFLAAFPQAAHVVLLRHPAANVHSALRWFERGRLVELRRDLMTFVETLAAQRIADRYTAEIELCRSRPDSLALATALWWRVANETLVTTLDGRPGARMLRYEDLAADPIATLRAIFAGFALAWTDDVERCVRWSRQGGAVSTDPLVTVRAAGSEEAWRSEIDPNTASAVDAIVADSPLMARFGWQ